jgi:hypothetical protein
LASALRVLDVSGTAFCVIFAAAWCFIGLVFPPGLARNTPGLLSSRAYH